MTKVANHHEPADLEAMSCRAVAGRTQALGRTAGEALDALAAHLSHEDADTLVIVRGMSPDRFLTAEQRRRLRAPMARLQDARARNIPHDPVEEAELEQLIEAEIRATTARASALLQDLGQ